MSRYCRIAGFHIAGLERGAILNYAIPKSAIH
jgi:hypothetical protein